MLNSAVGHLDLALPLHRNPSLDGNVGMAISILTGWDSFMVVAIIELAVIDFTTTQKKQNEATSSYFAEAYSLTISIKCSNLDFYWTDKD